MTVINDLSDMNTPLAMLGQRSGGGSDQAAGLLYSPAQLLYQRPAAAGGSGHRPVAGGVYPHGSGGQNHLGDPLRHSGASSTTLFAIRYRRDSQVAAQMFTLSTLLSAVSLPVLTLVCGLIIH